MTSMLRLFATATAVLLAAPLLLPAAAQNISPAQRTEIEAIIKDYLVKNPEVLQEAYGELEKRQAAAEAEKHQSAVKDNAAALFNSKRQVVLGNPQGDVTMVEFFDYNCGYCKRALSDMLEMLKADPKLRVVLKEFPVLGEGSVEAARVAVAARMQDASGRKYLDFHQKLLGNRGSVARAQALAAAKDAGFDMARLEKDMAGEEPKATIEESFKLADALGLSGTPSYVVGPEVVIGAVGLPNLREKVNTARCGKPTC
jgi:protein-disulfide isomerase